MKFDKSTGIIEMFMDSLEVTDEGTFTFNLVDGKAKGTTSLVLIGDGKLYYKVCFYIHNIFRFVNINGGRADIYVPVGAEAILQFEVMSTERQPW